MIRAAGGRKTSFPASRMVSAGVLLASLLVAGPIRAAPDLPLVRLVKALPWPGVSEMIGFRGRLWFVNSVKFVNHNSADLYAFDPARGVARFEKHLFSQDAGTPAIAGGLLYWPFEDSRFSPGHGEFMVTDGVRWQWRLIPNRRAFHTHAMASHGGALYAATSAWRARVLRSDDGGASWRLIYSHDTPARKVSRITTLAGLGGTLYAGLTTWYDDLAPKLLRWTGTTFAPVPFWPAGSAVRGLVAYRGWLYGTNLTEDGSALWRTDGRRAERVTALDGHVVAGVAAGQDTLWAVSRGKTGGRLWRSGDGVRWAGMQAFEPARPLGLAVLGGGVYVGLMSDAGGELWGPPTASTSTATAARMRAASFGPPPLLPADSPVPLPQGALATLDEALAGTKLTRRFRTAVLPFAVSRAPDAGAALARRLARGRFPAAEISMIGGNLIVPAAKMARWYLMWGMAHSGGGRVPPELIDVPWTAKPNRAEKYFEPTPAAAWAVARLGQGDPTTLGALIGRLGRGGDPDWLTGDLVGALTDLTGRRFGYDIPAWRRWWKARKQGR